MHTPLVILDRDGTVNHDSDDYIKSADEWVALPGAIDAIAKLNHAGWRVVIASNQSGLGRGLFDVATLNQMHDKMNKALAKAGGRVDAIFYCPHTPACMVEFGNGINRTRQCHPLISRLDVVVAVMVDRAVSVQNHQWGVHAFALSVCQAG